MNLRAAALLFLLWPMAAQAQAPAQSSCTLMLKAAFDMDMDSTGRITIPVDINGTSKRMMVDTGATYSVLTARTISDLNLRTRLAGGSLIGFGGRIMDRLVEIDEFAIGRLKGNNFYFYALSDDIGSAGLLGANFLTFFDLDFDFARAKLNLMAPEHCPGQVVYWSRGAYGVVPFVINDNHIQVEVLLDGQKVTAILDTGAADTVMSLESASDAFNLDSRKLAKSRHYPFKALSFGGVGVNNPAIFLVPDEESTLMARAGMHMIIGMGVLRRLHLYISYKEKKIYVTPATQY